MCEKKEECPLKMKSVRVCAQVRKCVCACVRKCKEVGERERMRGEERKEKPLLEK